MKTHFALTYTIQSTGHLVTKTSVTMNTLGSLIDFSFQLLEERLLDL